MANKFITQLLKFPSTCIYKFYKIYVIKYSHRFPFFCKVHNLTINYESYVYDEASWDVPVHSSNYRYHLNKINKQFHITNEAHDQFKKFIVLLLSSFLRLTFLSLYYTQ